MERMKRAISMLLAVVMLITASGKVVHADEKPVQVLKSPAEKQATPHACGYTVRERHPASIT